MAEQSPDKIFVNVVGPPIMAALGAALTWLTAGSTGVIGSALTALLTIIGGISGLAFSLIYRRYLGVLASGGKRKGTPEREAYERLRDSLSGGNMATRLYTRLLTGFLDTVDRFFGDASMADRTLFPRAFWLKTPAPLWTAPAFDRCLLLALIYPIATIFLIWAVSGHVGPAEEALKIRSDLSSWQRGLAVALLTSQGFAFWLGLRTAGWKCLAWNAVAVGGVATVAGLGIGAFDDRGFSAAAFAGASAVAFAIAIRLAVTGAVAVAGTIAFNVIAGIAFAGTGAHTEATASASAVASSFAIAGTGACALAAAWFRLRSIGHQWHGIFLSGFAAVLMLACLVSAYALAPLATWKGAGILLLILGLLTLINAPFDWLSLGLTRALLRRGLELGGWWPYVVALADDNRGQQA